MVATLRRRLRPPDPGILLPVLTLLVIGLVMVYSSSSVKAEFQYKDQFYFLKRQLVWSLLGLVSLYFFTYFNYWHWEKLARPFFGVALILLVLVLIPGIGKVVNGARRWIGVAGFPFQPAELMKLAFVLYAALYFEKRRSRLREFWAGVIPLLLLTGMVFGLILLEPDLGTALTIGGTAFIMLFAAGASIWQLVALILGALPGLIWAVFGAEYRRRRFLAFLDPWADPQGSGFHIIQALYAIGSGGLFGVGLGQSRQKLFYLPEQHTDFIFAILSEELGFFGGLLVLALFFFFAWRGFRTALGAPDYFSGVLAIGITVMITLQAIMNIAVVTASIPITGIPLPFVSYGGSSLIFTLAAVGVLLNISRHAEY